MIIFILICTNEIEYSFGMNFSAAEIKDLLLIWSTVGHFLFSPDFSKWFSDMSTLGEVTCSPSGSIEPILGTSW